MEDLVKSLEGSFHVTKEANSTACPHPRYAQYKQKTSNNDQESRRRQLLEIQKSNRLNYTNLVRKLTDDVWSDEEEEEDDLESMDVEVVLKKPGRQFKNQLMLSEWLVEVPNNLQTEWLTVICPIAKRCLVVASMGKTRSFTKSGYCLNRFPSLLPGGIRKNKSRGGSILDCLYCEVSRTFYVLDLMCWNGHPIYDSETEFRFYWMHEKFKEDPRLGEISKINPYKFVPLPSFASVPSDLTGALEGATFEIDGLLFYHKRCHYTFGSTPLVVWLKPYMLTEILAVPVPTRQMQRMPAYYTNYADHMKMVEEQKKLSYQEKGQKAMNRAAKNGKKVRPRNVNMKDEEGETEKDFEGGMEAQHSTPVPADTVDLGDGGEGTDTAEPIEDCVEIINDKG